MNEGHITDFSITALPLESLFIPRGQSLHDKPWGGHRWSGRHPHAMAATQCFDLCATGADELSTVRTVLYTDLKRKVERMDEALLGQLTEMGLPEGMTDPNQILAWVVGKMKPNATEAPEPIEKMDETPMPPEEEKKVENMAGEDEKPKEDVVEAIGRALRTDAKRRKEIRSLCDAHKIERSFSDQLCDDGVDLNTARAKVLERMATKPVGQSVDRVSVTESADDKTFAAMRDGLVMRTFRQGGIRGQAVGKTSGRTRGLCPHETESHGGNVR
jgi:hypothetical protein